MSKVHGSVEKGRSQERGLFADKEATELVTCYVAHQYYQGPAFVHVPPAHQQWSEGTEVFAHEALRIIHTGFLDKVGWVWVMQCGRHYRSENCRLAPPATKWRVVWEKEFATKAEAEESLCRVPTAPPYAKGWTPRIEEIPNG